MEIDLLLHGGTVVDGRGGAPYPADVGISGGRIATVRATSTTGEPAARVVDCAGLTVSPGFVDIHTHVDFTVTGTPAAETALAQGVTTLVTGNCGFAPFPIPDGDPGPLQQQSGFLAGPAAPTGWDWTDAATFGSAVEGTRPAVNVALQAGHHALRLAVVGAENRPATLPEIDAMCALLERAAEQGVFGFSTGLIYAPGRFSEPAEVQALATVAARRGLLYSTHVRDETTHVERAVDEAIDTARATGARLEVSHLKALGRAAHGRSRALLDLLDAARRDGVDVTADVYPFTASSTTLSTRLPSWALDGGADALVHRLRDPSARAAIADALHARVAAGEVDPGGIMLAGLPPGRYGGSVGLGIDEIARRAGSDPVDTILDVLAEHRGQASIVNHSMTGDDVATILADPHVSIASDGAILRATPDPSSDPHPHPRSFATFASVLGEWVRDRQVLTVPDAVRRMTALPASRVGLTDRGVIEPGAVADVAVWDSARIRANSTYADPWHLASGVELVLVGGVPAWEAGSATGARNGRVLRRSAAEAAA